MDVHQAQCRLVNYYRKKQQNWIQIELRHTRKVQTMPASELVLNHKDKLSYFDAEDITIILQLSQNKVCPIIEKFRTPKIIFLYQYLIAIQIVVLIAANIMSSKVIHIFGIDITAGAICFPITYSVSNIIVELFNLNYARKAIFISVISSICVMCLLEIAILMPAANTWPHQAEFSLILHNSARIFLASSLAFAIGDLCNCHLLSRLKNAEFYLPLLARLILACLFGFFIDSVIFLLVAHHHNLMPYSTINMILNVFCHKMIYELLTASIVFYIIKILKRRYQTSSEKNIKISFIPLAIQK